MKASEMNGEELGGLAVRVSPGVPWIDGAPMPDQSHEDAMTLALHHGLSIRADGPLIKRTWSVGYGNTHCSWLMLWIYQDHCGIQRTDIHDGEGSSTHPRMNNIQVSGDVREAICRCVVTNVLGHEVP